LGGRKGGGGERGMWKEERLANSSHKLQRRIRGATKGGRGRYTRASLKGEGAEKA